MKLKRDKKTGVWYRPETYDKKTLRSVRSEYKDLKVKGKVVFDVGGHIGSFSHHIADKAKKIIIFEPDPDNFRVLTKNLLDKPHIKRKNAALVAGDSKWIKLYVNSGKVKGMHSIIKRRGRKSVDVKCLRFSTMLKKYKPSVIKMDIEGAEYELLERPLPEFVKQLAMEIHLNKRGFKREAKKLIQSLADQGFRILKEPKLSKKRWATTASFKRD